MLREVIIRLLGIKPATFQFPAAIPFVDPIFGDCRYSPDTQSWTARGQFAGIDDLLLRGRSERPTEAQLSLWEETQEQLPTMLDEAIKSVSMPTGDTYTPALFNKREAALEEVRFEADGTVIFFFSPTLTDSIGYEMSPMVTFKDWRLISSEWSV